MDTENGTGHLHINIISCGFHNWENWAIKVAGQVRESAAALDQNWSPGQSVFFPIFQTAIWIELHIYPLQFILCNKTVIFFFKAVFAFILLTLIVHVCVIL